VIQMSSKLDGITTLFAPLLLEGLLPVARRGDVVQKIGQPQGKLIPLRSGDDRPIPTSIHYRIADPPTRVAIDDEKGITPIYTPLLPCVRRREDSW
jgi:hypothetical protein